MTDRLAGKTAVITGASSGIGRAMALALATEGADVVINYRRSSRPAAAVVAEIGAMGRRALAVQADVGRQEDASRLVDEAAAWLGRIDIWINNAGSDIITRPHRERSASDRLDMVLATDVRGTALCCWAVGPRMRAEGQGVILNIGWDKAWTNGMAGTTAELFALSKAAVMGFTKSLARSLAPQVRVNCVAPGFVQTAWGETVGDAWQERVLAETPLGRWGQPEDLAQAAVFLASDEAHFITGQILYVNGGVVM
jgi:3-oxoacyl-[acyl-carrier protein] reductase